MSALRQTPSRLALKQPAFDAFASVDLLLADRLQVEEAALGSVALFAHDDVDAHQLRLVAEHLDEPRVRHKHEVLIRSLAQLNGLFPAVILAHHQRPDAVRHESLHNTAARDVQVMVDLARSFVGEGIELPGGEDPRGQFGLQAGAAFVVPLVDRLQRTAVDQKRREAGLVESYRREIVQSDVDRRYCAWDPRQRASRGAHRSPPRCNEKRAARSAPGQWPSVGSRREYPVPRGRHTHDSSARG